MARRGPWRQAPVHGSVLVLGLAVVAILSVGAMALLSGVALDVDLAAHAERSAIAEARHEASLERAESWLEANATWLSVQCEETPGFETIVERGAARIVCLDQVEAQVFFRVTVFTAGDARRMVRESTFAVARDGRRGLGRQSWRRWGGMNGVSLGEE